MRLPAMLPLLLLCASCGNEATPEDLEAQAERDIAMVEAANNAAPPLREVTPEPILYPDIERHDMYGAACNYAPGTSLGTRVIARPADAFIKLDGEVLRFAADPGSRELPAGTRSHYDGREYSLRLELEGAGEPVSNNTEVVEYEGEIDLRDRWGRVVYSGTGLARCGP